MFGALVQKSSNFKQLQFSIGLSIPENGRENDTFVLVGFKKPKESKWVSGSWGLHNSLN